MGQLPEFDPKEQTTESEVIPHEPPANERSLARRIALQILYEVDSARHDPGAVTAIHLQGRQVNRKTARHVQRLVKGVVENRAMLDDIIHRYAPEFPVAQIAIIDRNILRLAFYELAVRKHLAVAIAINEAVGLASVFGAEGTPGFINGVLGALTDDKQALAHLRQIDEYDLDGDGDE